MDLARRFRGLPPDASQVARNTPFDYGVGDGEEFTLVDLEVPEMIAVSATVRLITDHAYFFIEDGVSYDQGDLERIGADFESIVYPKVMTAFGAEWTPGVDSDPRITLLHANLKGAGGYFSLSDEYPKAAVRGSNEREMLYLDAGSLGSPGPAYNALAAHELQHMIHSHADPDEDAWVNEGLSQVAAELAGGGSGWLDLFLSEPDTQLTDWPELGDTTIHYAASELFFRYVLDRFRGRERAYELLREQADGIEGVDAFLKRDGTSFLAVFSDWVVANYLDARAGPYSHAGVETSVPFEKIDAPGEGAGTVSQFAADYLKIDTGGRAKFAFDGADGTDIGVTGDGTFWWSGRGDGIDSRLTREFDLADAGRATLRFRVWAEIERGWDYGYVAASTDGGRTWKALPGQHTTAYDPVQNAYGQGYTGETGGWQDEEIDLTPYAGGKVLVRFEYVTDDATNRTGFAVDGIDVPEIGYREPEDGGGWTAEGFQRTDGHLRQRFIVQLIEDDDPDRVTQLRLDDANHIEDTWDGPFTVVISGIAEGTTEKAPYTWSLAAP